MKIIKTANKIAFELQNKKKNWLYPNDGMLAQRSRFVNKKI